MFRFLDTENLVDRFRGNFVIGGGAAFEEEAWGKIKIGDVMFQVTSGAESNVCHRII